MSPSPLKHIDIFQSNRGNRILWFLVMLVGLALASACANTSGRLGLRPAVQGFNQDIRWQRFQSAARMLPAKERADFIRKYTATEEELGIQSIEVESVEFSRQPDAQEATVTAVVTYYLLPSIVVKKEVITQHWQLLGTNWRMTSQEPVFIASPPSALTMDETWR